MGSGGASPFTSLFGSNGFFSYEKQRTEEDSSVRPDPLTQRSNRLRMRQLQDALGATGGYKGLYGPESDKLFQLGSQAQRQLQRYIQEAQRPGLTPEMWYRDARAATDPAAQIAAGRDVFNKLVTPQVQGQYAQMGLGRSGALGEGLSMAGAQMALPIATEAQRQRFEIERQRPNVETELAKANLARSQQAFAATDFTRQLQVANWQRKVQGMNSALGLVPYVAGSDSQSVSRNYGSLLMDMLQTVIGLAASVIGQGGYQNPQSTPPLQTQAIQQPPGGYPSPGSGTPQVPTTSSYMQPQYASYFGGGGGMPGMSMGMGGMGFA